MRSTKSIRVHFSTTNLNAGPAVCGEDRDPRRRLTLDVDAVTCKRCMKTDAFGEATDTVEELRTDTTRGRYGDDDNVA